jgi:hypothetical protein
MDNPKGIAAIILLAGTVLLFCCIDSKPPARTIYSNPNVARSAAKSDTGNVLRQLEAVESRLRTEAERQAKHNGRPTPEEGELLSYNAASLSVVWHRCNSDANRLATYSVRVDSSGHATRADIIHSSGIASCDDAIKAAAIKSAWHCRRVGVNCRIESALSLGSPEHRRVITPARETASREENRRFDSRLTLSAHQLSADGSQVGLSLTQLVPESQRCPSRQ